jgi:hypothetical protein
MATPGRHSLAISIEVVGSRTPELGRTQYFFGAVVLILNNTFLSDGFVSFMYEVTGALKGPGTDPDVTKWHRSLR